MPSQAKLSLSEISDGKMHTVDLDGEEVVVAAVDGKCFAFGGLCTHEGAPMADGELADGKVVCPWHFTEFDIETGEVIDGVAEDPLPVYQVEVDGDDVRVSKR